MRRRYGCLVVRRRWLLVASLLLLFVGALSILATLGHGTGSDTWTPKARASDGASNGFDAEVPTPLPQATLTCLVGDQGGADIPDSTCTFLFGTAEVTLPAEGGGAKELMLVPAQGELTAAAPGYYPETRGVDVTQDATEVFILVPLPSDEPSEPAAPPAPEEPGSTVPKPTGSRGAGDPDGGPGTGATEDAEAPPPPPPPEGWKRVWREPVAVCAGCGYEPGVMADSGGTIYVNPTTSLWRSDDGGYSWISIYPALPALPNAAGDTAIYVAPDDSLWFSQYWGYAGGTMGCTSVDRGNTWQCDNSAIPGITDRMWIAAKNNKVGYLETGEALSKPEWAVTQDGSLLYDHPCAVYPANGQTGNMVYDAVNDKFLVYTGGNILWVDSDTPGTGCHGSWEAPGLVPGTIPSLNPGFGGTHGLPWLHPDRGTYWTNRNPGYQCGAPWANAGQMATRLTVGRSYDEGDTWTAFPINTEAFTIALSYTTAGPADLVGSHIPGDLDLNGGPGLPGTDYAITVYYGSDVCQNAPGVKGQVMGNWSLYVADSEDANGAAPVWVEQLLLEDVHTGNMCTGLLCEQNGDDPTARFAGDLIGSWVDREGLAHIAFQIGGNPMYMRQDWIYVE